MGDKMFNKPEEYQQRLESLQSLREVWSFFCVKINQSFTHAVSMRWEQAINQVHTYAQDLQDEWSESQQWADLSCFDQVEINKFQPATQEIDAIYIKMETQLKEETSLLQTLQEINKDAVHLKSLIRHQVHSENLKRPLRVLKSPVPRIAKTTIFLRPYDSLLTIFLVRLNGALR